MAVLFIYNVMDIKDYFRLFDATAKANEHTQYKSDMRGDLYLFEKKLNHQTKQILKLYRTFFVLKILLLFILTALFFFLQI